MNLHLENQQATSRAAFALVHELTRLSVTEPKVTPLSPSRLLQGPTQEPLSALWQKVDAKAASQEEVGKQGRGKEGFCCVGPIFTVCLPTLS